jgi:hypothetical protein
VERHTCPGIRRRSDSGRRSSTWTVPDRRHIIAMTLDTAGPSTCEIHPSPSCPRSPCWPYLTQPGCAQLVSCNRRACAQPVRHERFRADNSVHLLRQRPWSAPLRDLLWVDTWRVQCTGGDSDVLGIQPGGLHYHEHNLATTRDVQLHTLPPSSSTGNGVTEYICNPQNAPSRCARTYRTHTGRRRAAARGHARGPGSSSSAK